MKDKMTVNLPKIMYHRIDSNDKKTFNDMKNNEVGLNII